MRVSCKAAPANVTDIVDLPDLLRTERAERLRLQTELDSLTGKFTELEGTLHMQRDGGKVYHTMKYLNYKLKGKLSVKRLFVLFSNSESCE